MHGNSQCSENTMKNYQLTRNWQHGQLIALKTIKSK